MSFRDDRLALLERAEERERAVTAVERELAQVRTERDQYLARVEQEGLDPKLAARVGSRLLHRALDRTFVLVWLFAGATFSAGYRSESYGMGWSVGLAFALGLWIPTRILRRHGAAVRLVAALAGVPFALAAWALFFATLWRAL